MAYCCPGPVALKLAGYVAICNMAKCRPCAPVRVYEDSPFVYRDTAPCVKFSVVIVLPVLSD